MNQMDVDAMFVGHASCRDVALGPVGSKDGVHRQIAVLTMHVLILTANALLRKPKASRYRATPMIVDCAANLDSIQPPRRKSVVDHRGNGAGYKPSSLVRAVNPLATR